MKSTGEVMGISRDFGISFAKAQVSAGNKLVKEGKLFLSLTDFDKRFAGEIGKIYEELGFEIVATSGTYSVLLQEGVKAKKC